MKRISLGSRVQIAHRETLNVALRRRGEFRPQPCQMLWAGRKSRVKGYRRGLANRALYLLDDAPGLWLEEWIDPISCSAETRSAAPAAEGDAHGS